MLPDVLPAATGPSASVRVGKIVRVLAEFFYAVCNSLSGETGVITYFRYSVVTEYGRLFSKKKSALTLI
jgi:hypothetical protein